MLTSRKLWLVGGDRRQAALAGLLAEDGNMVRTYGLEQALPCRESLEGIREAACVILPLPALGEDGGLYLPLSHRKLAPETVLDALAPGQRVLAGRVTPALAALALDRGLALADYFAREELAVLNAIPTAEGAIALAMELLPITLHDARVLLLGYGRVGQALGPRLRGLGARVRVAARRAQQRALARGAGLEVMGLDGLKEWLAPFDLVVNTVPRRVLGVEELAALKEGTPVIDLASLPGGVDDASAAALGVRVEHALSLPGKTAPDTAAAYLRDTVYHLLED